ncbi:variable large family protein [Borrelia crocidurae]|uniref:Variable large protein n=1 Tax=Borrelia crocidurae (strain Achema) TaxID=1155096 RepID=I0FEJ2_BORCA|nr:variable large family protein [Borrelia crocidurae]AFI31898.1 Vlp protein, delta subfamily [Borrelia crocidurae str. Achema]
MVMGCNSGGVKDPEKVFLSEMVNLGKGFMEVFVSFGDMITGTLGIKADTKKSEIGKYFSDIEKSMQTTKAKLNEILEKNGQYEKVKTVVEQFISGTVDKIAAGAKEAALGASGSGVIGNAVQNQDAVPGETASVNALVKGIKEIVEVVLRDKGNPEASKTEEGERKSIAKLLSGKGATDGEEKHAAAASASIGAVSGADILQAIAKSVETVGEVDIDQAKDAASIAAASKKDNADFTDARKDAVIAGGIALRAMAKDGQLSAKTGENKSAYAINGAVASAVNKVLSTLTIAIRNTVDEGLKGISEVLGEIKQGEGSEAKVKAN